MNDTPGNIFRPDSPAPKHGRGVRSRPTKRVLIVDGILASRVALAHAVALPHLEVQTASQLSDARRFLESSDFALILVNESNDGHSGEEMLVEFRREFPLVARALVARDRGAIAARNTIERAGLSFLARQPWTGESLRRMVYECVFSDIAEGKTWRRAVFEQIQDDRNDSRGAEILNSVRDHDVLVRGLLAGLNACESELELFELMHSEFVTALGVSRWVWVDESARTFTRVAGDWPVDEALALELLSVEEKVAHRRSVKCARVARLDEASHAGRAPAPSVCISLVIRDRSDRIMTCLAWLAPGQAGEFIRLMREVHAGLQLAVRRIRSAAARAEAALQLAERVSRELRQPVGALAHAIDRLRGEAERAGLSIEWVERVTCESKRVMEAVKQVEDEMRTDPAGHGAVSFES